jgi:hypothetical protein
MTLVGQPERATQNRVVALFRDELGYRYLGDRSDREGNSNIEEGLSAWLTRSGYAPAQISAALYRLRTAADNHSHSLYDNNRAVYGLLRYGVPVKTEAGKPTETVHLINWRKPEENDFALAEEVTLQGSHQRRPDIVLYVNGIAVGQARPRLLCSLVHKFGPKGVPDFEAFLKDLEARPSATLGELFVFVDECHRRGSAQPAAGGGRKILL